MLIFLDFDGVLHPNLSHERFIHVPRFEAVMREYGDIKIVISSAWQEFHSLPSLRANFSDDIAARIVDGTRSADPLGEEQERYRQIIRYLLHNGGCHQPWLALDDAVDEFPQECPQLVACNGDVGFEIAEEQLLRAAFLRLLPRSN